MTYLITFSFSTVGVLLCVMGLINRVSELEVVD